MDIKNKVVESQRKIIDSLAECELQIGKLYEKYAVRFPEIKTLWLCMATAEMTHHDLLKTMHNILNRGKLFYNLGKFSDEAIQPMITLIKDSQKNADLPDLKAAEAIATALKIESSLMDSHFYDVVSSDAPEFQIIAKRLSSDTGKHVEMVRSHFAQQF